MDIIHKQKYKSNATSNQLLYSIGNNFPENQQIHILDVNPSPFTMVLNVLSQNPNVEIVTLGTRPSDLLKIRNHKNFISNAQHHLKMMGNDEDISRFVRSENGWDIMVVDASRIRDIVDARNHAQIVFVYKASLSDPQLQKAISKYSYQRFVEPDIYILEK